MDDLFELHNLKKILGYNDIRTIRAWSKKNNVPIIILGRKSYVTRQSIDNLVQNQLPGCIHVNDSSKSIIDVIRKDECPVLSKDTKPRNFAPKPKEMRRNKNKHSKAATDLLNAIFD